LETPGKDAASHDVIHFHRIIRFRMFLAEQVRSTLRRASIQKLELLSSENTHFEYRNDFIEIVILCLLFSYLVYNAASAPEADYLTR